MTKKIQRQIIAIGGGGFSRFGEYTPSNSVIEEYILKQTRKKSPSVCFIPTASGEAPKYIIDFYRFFGNLGAKPSHLSLFELPSADIESFLLEQDAIYVGGGNTKSMIALWKEWKLDVVLKKAWEAGVVLSGVSAGANCWFEECVTDSIPGKLTSLKCLGFLKGSCCPHYNGESQRRPSYHQMIRKKQMRNGIAIEDHAAVHYIGNKIKRVINSNKSDAAYHIYLKNKVLKEVKLGIG